MRNTFAVVLLLLLCGFCFGQSSYKGLTPGQSTRADVERVLGQPVKSVSKTLVEYKNREAVATFRRLAPAGQTSSPIGTSIMRRR
jgi:hypothetical protein